MGLLFTADMLKKASSRNLGHRQAFRDKEDGGEMYDDICFGDKKTQIISSDNFEEAKTKNFIEGIECCLYKKHCFPSKDNFVITTKSDSNSDSNNFLELYSYGKKLEEDGRIEILKFTTVGFIASLTSTTEILSE